MCFVVNAETKFLMILNFVINVVTLSKHFFLKEKFVTGMYNLNTDNLSHAPYQHLNQLQIQHPIHKQRHNTNNY